MRKITCVAGTLAAVNLLGATTGCYQVYRVEVTNPTSSAVTVYFNGEEVLARVAPHQTTVSKPTRKWGTVKVAVTSFDTRKTVVEEHLHRQMLRGIVVSGVRIKVL